MEARWAVFMDTLKILYEYEPNAYQLGDLRYLPDFLLLVQDIFLEIKSPLAPALDYEKCSRLALATGKDVVVISYAPTPDSDGGYLFTSYKDEFGKIVAGEDSNYLWCECPHCGRVELQFDGRADRIKCGCPKSPHGDKGYNSESPRILQAYQNAKSYRFEPRENTKALKYV